MAPSNPALRHAWSRPIDATIDVIGAFFNSHRHSYAKHSGTGHIRITASVEMGVSCLNNPSKLSDS